MRRGWAVTLDGIALLPVETTDPQELAIFDTGGRHGVLIAGSRAATLKLANQRDAAMTDDAVLVERTDWLSLPATRALADPSTDLTYPLQGPYRALPGLPPAVATAAVELARLAGILPAFFVGNAPGEVQVTADAVLAFEAPALLQLITRARLPVLADESAEITAFRGRDGGVEHVALLLGQPDGAPPLVRLHSECLTGDVLGSLKCDCGPQLHEALRLIAASGWGILLYLRQEGRGIGLANKLRAYRLQDQGFDTVDANLRLGFAVDARDFGVAAAMLRLLGQDRVRLLTNNPAKVAGLERAGIAVVERVPHHLPPNPHNIDYLATKRDRTGHQL